MPLDGLKEFLGVLKFWLGVVVASMLGIGGWLITNFQKTKTWLLAVGGFVVVCLVIVCLVLMKIIGRTINKITKAKKC